MPRYIRANVPGGTYFFTVALLERNRTLLTDHIELLREASRKVRIERPFKMAAVVVLPDHLHCIWTLPADDADFSSRWRLIKAAFARGIGPGERISPRRALKSERGIWQRRFWEHAVRNDADFTTHTDYVHYNPVKHGHVRRVADWPHSSFHSFVNKGVYPADWGGTERTRESDFE